MRSNDVGDEPRDEPPSKKQCLDNADVPGLSKTFLKFPVSHSTGNHDCINYLAQRTYRLPVPEGGGFGSSMKITYGGHTYFFESRDVYKKSSAYDYNNISPRGQETLEENTAANRWNCPSGQAIKPAGEYNSYGTVDHAHYSTYRAPFSYYGRSCVLPNGRAACVSDKDSGYGSKGAQYERNSFYEQENVSSCGQETFEDSTDTNSWYFRHGETTELVGECNSYSYCLSYRAPYERHSESPVPAGGFTVHARDKGSVCDSMSVHYKQSSAYEQEKNSLSRQKTLKDRTPASGWNFRFGRARELAGEYSGYSKPDPSCHSYYGARHGHYGELSIHSDGLAAQVANKDSGSGWMNADGGNVVVEDPFAASGSNPSENLGYARGKLYFDDTSGSECADSLRFSFTSKPDPRGSAFKTGYPNNFTGVNVDFPQKRSVKPSVTNTGVYHPEADFLNKSQCESTATGADGEASIPSTSFGGTGGQNGGSDAVRTLYSNYAFKPASTIPSDPKMSAVLAGQGSDERRAYSDDCVRSLTSTVNRKTADSMCKTAPETLPKNNTFIPASGETPYQPSNSNFSILNSQANNQAACNDFSNSTSGPPNFVPSVALDANVWSGGTNAISQLAYPSEKLTCSQRAYSVSAVAGIDDGTGSMNVFSPVINNESSAVTVGVKSETVSNMPEYAVTTVDEEPTIASAPDNGALFDMHPNSEVVVKMNAEKVKAKSGSNIANGDESSAEAGTEKEDLGSTGQIGPQAYPPAYEGILKSLMLHAVDAANRPKRKLKWPLPIPLSVKPHRTELTFNDIDYTWVTHDIQVTVKDELYAHMVDTDGMLQVFVNSPRAANSLLNLNCVAGLPVKISVARNYTDSIGYIRRVPRRYSDAVLFEFLEDQGLLCAKRQIGYMMSDKLRSKSGTTGTVQLFFMPDRILPSIVTIDSISYDVTRRIEQPLQCFNCQRFGHGKHKCRDSTRCLLCAGPHIFTQCKRQSKPKCVNCNQAHASTYFRCPVRLAYSPAKPRN